MPQDAGEQGVLFEGLSKKAVIAKFDQDHASSDGGAILLKACDERLRLSETLAARLPDGRERSKVAHSPRELFRQRLSGIACGYADGNGAARLANDPAMKSLTGRDPVAGEPLASRPTLPRSGNTARSRDLARLPEALAERAVARRGRRRKRVRRTAIDPGPTVDPAHGGQRLTLLNGFHGASRCLPLAGFPAFGNEVERHLFRCVLRPGNAAAKRGRVGALKRSPPRLRRAFPGARSRIRLDGGFPGPELFAFFEAERSGHVAGMAKNPAPGRLAGPLMAQARSDSGAGRASARRYGEFACRARSWPHGRRAVAKAEAAARFGRQPKGDPRFLAANLKTTPKHACERVHCARGDAGNRLREPKLGLEIDRASCTRFLANQLRVPVTAAAYALTRELRLRARWTSCARARAGALRLRLLKLGAWIEASVRRIAVHLPLGAPFAGDWRRIARSVGAVAT